MTSKKLMDYMLIIAGMLVVLFAWWDSKQVIGLKQIDDTSPAVWDIFWKIISPANFILFMGILAALGIIWYLYSKDKSESLALFLVPATLIIFSVQDVVYYIWSSDTLADVGCWADVSLPIRTISNLMGEACPTGNSMIVTAILGLAIAYYAYKYLKEAKW